MWSTILVCTAIAISAATGQQPPPSTGSTARQRRQALLAELRPVTLKNCTLRRYGGAHDGGYVMCENLITGVESAYSYGIDTEDNWGCQLSKQFNVPIHQYDCFTEHRPACEGGRFIFHDECVGDKPETVRGEPFDSLTNQIARNGDRGKRLVVKMDVEGAEWSSLLATPDSVLDRIDQLPLEFHGVDDERSLAVVRKLKRNFYLVNLHFNNFACSSKTDPFPSWAYQALWVNKRIGLLGAPPPNSPSVSAVNAPDNPSGPDCQLPAVRSKASGR